MNPKANRLAAEKSPYLLQHAHNPVDWLPWGPEAFETARRLDRPIFLSIGYSTCHWCHVMERECFEDEEVAALLNRTVVSVKVDREERPDIDHVYMTFCQAMTGRGGWPLTAILTPEGKPFFAGTYFPKGGSPDRPGLMDIIARLGQLWAANRADLLENAEDLTRRLAEFMEPRPRSGHGDDRRDVGPALLAEAASDLARQYDRERGGFGQAPKFPSAHLPIFLLRQAARANRPKYRRMALKTLAAMRLGGLYDHLGFGFHRYSTDADWLLPHFEKMLYDQAMLALAYAEAWQVSRGPLFRQTTLEILDFLAREMTSPEGAFYSALDADSEGEEGRFYVLTEDEVRAALPPEEAGLFLATYNFRPEGNFRDEATGRATGANIPYLAAPPGSDLEARLAPIRQTLLSWREKRPRPHRDDKILTDLNGLAIAAMARAGRIFKRPDLVARAAGAADFILNTLRDDRGNLLHRYRDGQAAIPGLLTDHAFLALGLLELLAAESRPLRLRQALTLGQTLVERFEDPDKGGFFLTANEAEKLLFRPKDFTDAAIPSGNSVAVLVLGRLSRLTGRRDVEAAAERAVAAAMPQLGEHPSGHAFLLTGLAALLDPPPDVVVSGDPGDPASMALLEAASAALPPEGSLLALSPDTAAELAELAPRTRDMALPGGRAAAYVCAGRTCLPPLTDPAALAAALGS